jgi:hypothetical protein
MPRDRNISISPRPLAKSNEPSISAILCFPLRFPAQAMVEELGCFAEDEWLTHFNQNIHDGTWTGIALRAINGDPKVLHHTHNGLPYRDTPHLARCPVIAEVLSGFKTEIKAARLLRLAPGGHIREHRDDKLSFAQGEARLHIPLLTNDRVEFYLAGERVLMMPGELWYMDFTLPHRINNHGETDRVHLVIDCVINNWLAELMTEAANTPLPSRAALPPTAQELFEQFRESVFADPELQKQLQACPDHQEFVRRTVEAGRAAGFPFTEEEVRAAMNFGRRSWMEQWVL